MLVLNFLIVFMILVCVVLLIVFGVSYNSHVYMSKSQRLPYDYVTFDAFIREYERISDGKEIEYNWNFKSIFVGKIDSIIHLHADIVRIENKCMIFYPIDWAKYCMWMRSNFKEDHRVRGLWGKR